MLTTPKPGWAGFSITGALGAAFPDARVGIETDVNAAALAEADGLDDLVYITIGTGCGCRVVEWWQVGAWSLAPGVRALVSAQGGG